MAVIAEIRQMQVYVYERHGGGSFKRIATFGAEDDAQADTRHAAHVLYGGRVHYDALEVC